MGIGPVWRGARQRRHRQFMCRFQNGAMGHLMFSRVAQGRKMGYAYEITGTKGAIRFDQEDQNALWLYLADDPAPVRGFRKILTGPEHPDYLRSARGRARDGLSGPDHHRGEGLFDRGGFGAIGLADVPRRAGGSAGDRCGVGVGGLGKWVDL